MGDYPQWSNAPYFCHLAQTLGNKGHAPVNAQVFARGAGLGPSLLADPRAHISAERPRRREGYRRGRLSNPPPHLHQPMRFSLSLF